ncbi:non-contractile tail sheath protein [Paenibacillus ehimensis]|uniref:FN3 associated domain-containing protein n=1 Tax=Paenibacillus ehimensis TaxID=79264 RepID=A0ABT8VCJ4_9BACL|nr:chitobiase/beta-hexosaminidase C-terminal domain-containing protein [Paenibacillus ehimensis]MDO3678677.1 FN3 associated domain-containing protein [Paenibacillus ehimensis]
MGKNIIIMIHGYNADITSWGYELLWDNSNPKVDGFEAVRDISSDKTFSGRSYRKGDILSKSSFDRHFLGSPLTDEQSQADVGIRLQEEYVPNKTLFGFQYLNKSEGIVAKGAQDLVNYIYYLSTYSYISEDDKIILLTHSTGGLVARYAIENLGLNVHRLIAIAPPNFGSPLGGIPGSGSEDLDRDDSCVWNPENKACEPIKNVQTSTSTKYFFIGGANLFTTLPQSDRVDWSKLKGASDKTYIAPEFEDIKEKTYKLYVQKMVFDLYSISLRFVGDGVVEIDSALGSDRLKTSTVIDAVKRFFFLDQDKTPLGVDLHSRLRKYSNVHTLVKEIIAGDLDTSTDTGGPKDTPLVLINNKGSLTEPAIIENRFTLQWSQMDDNVSNKEMANFQGFQYFVVDLEGNMVYISDEIKQNTNDKDVQYPIVLEGINENETYLLRLMVKDKDDNWSDPSPPFYFRIDAKPQKVSIPVSQEVSSNSVQIIWGANGEDNIAYYEVYRNGVMIAQTDKAKYTDNNVNPSSAYTYSVVAVSNSGKKSDPSNTLKVRTQKQSYATGRIYKLKPKYLVTDFNFEMIASAVTTSENSFVVSGNFRRNTDLAGVSWETRDRYSHKKFRYPTITSFKDVKLSYNYEVSGYTAQMDGIISPTLTIETNSGENYFVRLWNYVVDRPLDDWEIGYRNYSGTSYTFPTGRTVRNGNGITGTIEIDFNNLYAGWAAYEWQPKPLFDENGEPVLDENGNQMYGDSWVPSPSWIKVPVDNIKSIMWSFIPSNWSDGNMQYLDDSKKFSVRFTNWTVSGDIYICDEPSRIPDQPVRLCDDYDDIYPLTPQRVVEEYKALGYGGVVNFYVGASHFYDKAYNGTEMAMKTDEVFNLAFKNWYENYVSYLKQENMTIIHSISMESVDAPSSWWQRTWDGKPGTTMWVPTPHLLSFTNPDLHAFYKKYVLELARISNDNNIKPIIQLGEPWWWFQEHEENKPPTFYDDSTRALYLKECGKPMHEFHSSTEDISEHGEMLKWLSDQIGRLTFILRDTVKSVYPNSEFTVLFFTPSVIDKDRVPKMMSIVNFPREQWRYPNLDFFMLEDYDYLIFNQMDKHLESMTFVQTELGYPVDKIHYFSGFALEDTDQVWHNIDQAVLDGYNQGFTEIYVWAYTQIKRRGWNPPLIICTNRPSGTYSNPFNMTLNAPKADKIIYTTDGSSPTLSNGFEYTVPLRISKDQMIKAVAVKNGICYNETSFTYSF